MRQTVPKVRIFLSSPDDVSDERAIARKVIADLQYDPWLRGAVFFEIVAWDTSGAPGLDARKVPQQTLNLRLARPSQCDIVVGILWSKLGTPFEMDGKWYPSGTVYELDDAIGGNGDVLIYRRMARLMFDARDPDLLEKHKQLQAVDEYFATFNDAAGQARRGCNEYDTPTDFEQKLTDHLKNILARSFTQPIEGEEIAPSWSGSPFPGLRAFTTVDAPIFFGRGRETDELLKKVADQNIVFVMGASGSGKSSLVGAGLLPRLRAGAISGSEYWHIPDFDPISEQWRGARFSPAEANGNPLLAFSEKISALAGQNPAKLASELCTEPWLIDKAVESIVAGGRKLVVFIDQFEEIFTTVHEKERRAFIQLLSHPHPLILWVITVRSDFYHRCVDAPRLARLLERGQFPLPAPTDTLLDMITRPAVRACIKFEEGLTSRILKDTGEEPGSLALMAYALDELYSLASQRSDRFMSSADYSGLGGVQGAIGKRAEATFTSLSGTSDQRKSSLHRVFRELVEIDDRGVATRRRALLGDAAHSEQDRAFVDAFVAARLLTTSEGEHGGLVEVAHEALFDSWMRLATWVENFQSDLRLLRQMRVAAAEWAANERGHDYLWPGDKGSQAQGMLIRLQPLLNDVEIAFSRPETAHLIDELSLSQTAHIRREAIGQRLLELGDPRNGVGCKDGLPRIAWCYVDVGAMDFAEFRDHQNKLFGTFNVRDFYCAKFPVTHAQFQSFIDAPNGVSNDDWWKEFETPDRKLPTSTQIGANYPIDSVTWHFSVAYCNWLNETFPKDMLPEIEGSRNDWSIRLPHEWEWQWAAGGANSTIEFPWGSWDPSRCNLKEAGIGRTVSVGLYPDGAAACGVMDMVGNVREWCLNVHKDARDIDYFGTTPRAFRGGSIYQDHLHAFTRYRASSGPSNPTREASFRLVYAPSLKFR